MKLDTTSKIVTLVSVIVGIMISVAGYFTSLKINSLDARLKVLDQISKGLDNSGKEMDISNKEYGLSARVIAEFQLPLARSFAEEYSTREGNINRILIPTSGLAQEFEVNIPKWKTRNGLMTGNACSGGLVARQVVTLIVKNIGYADATDVKIKAMQKTSPFDEPSKGWHVMSANQKAIPYYDLQTSPDGWSTIEFNVTELRGQSSPEKERNEAQVVLASVSGSTTLFGTVLVPIEISWTNKITKAKEVKRILESEVPKLRSALLGAEIGTACH